MLSGCTTLPDTLPDTRADIIGIVSDIDKGASFADSSTATSVWIDTDAACSGKRLLLDPDDCWALFYALKSSDINVQGISSVRGNASSSTALKSIKDVISQVNAESNHTVPIKLYKGAGKRYKQDVNQEPNEAVEALAAKLEDGRLTILAIGPLTNIAALLDHRPELASRIDRVIAVAGQRHAGLLEPEGSLFGFHDLNVHKDHEAFQRVLDAELPITLLPFELAQQMTLERSDLKHISRYSAGARWISKRSRQWDFAWRLTTKINGFHPYDLLAVSFAADPTQFQCKAASGKLMFEEGSSKKKELRIKIDSTGHIEYCVNLEKGFKPRVLEVLTR